MRETLKEYLDRGGKVAKVPKQETPPTKHVLPVRSTGSSDLIDLAGGAELYSEAAMAHKHPRKVKIDKRSQKISINAALLPPSLVGLLISLEIDANAARQQEKKAVPQG